MSVGSGFGLGVGSEHREVERAGGRQEHEFSTQAKRAGASACELGERTAHFRPNTKG